MLCSLQDIFVAEFESFAKQRRLHARERRAAACISSCYTEAAGFHFDQCEAGHRSEPVYHACRHRSCPKCAHKPRQQWLQAELGRLLPCAHFHIVFTLPHELLPLWEHNRQRMAQMLFDAARCSLLQLLHEPRLLGATPGLLMSLHTWGRTLSRHPHVHVLCTAGGVDETGRWRECRQDFLMPAEPLRRLYRGKLLAALRQGLAQDSPEPLKLPSRLGLNHWQQVLRNLYRAQWNVRINAPYAHGRGVALYLARYAKGGPLPSDRALELTNHHVSFGYTDHRDARRKRLRLHASEFIARLLWHAPVKGAHMVRHAGLYASACLRQHRQARIQLGLPAAAVPQRHEHPLAATLPEAAPIQCTVCRLPMRRVHVRPGYREALNEISSSISSANTPRTPTAGGALPNSAFKQTAAGLMPWPRAAVAHLAPRGQGISPSAAA